MTPQHFIPVSEPVNPVGYTPDPENPERPDIPEVPDIPFEVIPELEIPVNKLEWAPCRLRLRQGCYQIRMSPKFHTPFRRSYKGTMRVENAGDRFIISGDFYSTKPVLEPITQFADHGQFLTKELIWVKPVIPIYSRGSYYSYLKVVGFKRSAFNTIGRPCTITLTVEEYKYSHPFPGEANGSFPETPNRTLKIILQSAPSPDGFSGPSFTGKVYAGTRLLSYDFSMLWVSDYYRRARLELENVTGAPIISNASGNDFKSIYATAGWDLKVVTGNTDIAVPSGITSATNWTDANLHAFMLANRNPNADLDKVWHFHHVSLPFSSADWGSIFGIMFDQIEDHREGACNFFSNMTGAHNDNRAKLRSAAHEAGHGFNQLHPPHEELDSDNSIMSQSGPVKTVIEGSGGTYPDDINFAFNEHNAHHLKHNPDIVVRPGGEDWTFGHFDLFAPEATDNASEEGLEVEVNFSKSNFKLGEPVVFAIQLINNGKKEIMIPKRMGIAFHNVDVLVNKEGEEPKQFRPFIIVCDGDGLVPLKPGNKVVIKEMIYWDTKGIVFPSSGLYRVSAYIHWSDGIRSYLAAGTEKIWIDSPVSQKDNEVAALLLNDEVGKYIALGGNAVHLKEAVAKIDSARKKDKAHPAVIFIEALDSLNKKRKRKN